MSEANWPFVDQARASAFKAAEVIRNDENSAMKTDEGQLAFIGGAVWLAQKLPTHDEIYVALQSAIRELSEGDNLDGLVDSIETLIRDRLRGEA